MSELGDKLRALAAEADVLAGEQPPAIERDYSDFPGGPRLVKDINGSGVNIILRAPVNALWKPSLYAQMFGSGTAFLPHDPSNAPADRAARSPNGFPLVYPTGGAGVAGEPKVLNGESTFDSDQAVFDNMSAAEQRDANAAGWHH